MKRIFYRLAAVLALLACLNAFVLTDIAMACGVVSWFAAATKIGGSVGVDRQDIGEMPADPIQGAQPCADPVYVHSGELYYDCQALFIPGRGMDLDLRFHYRSGTTYNLGFGYGWTMNYYARLKSVDNGNIVIFKGNGRTDEYVYDATRNQYNPPPGLFEVVKRNSDNTWTLTGRHGDKQQFNSSGNLTSIEDRHGNKISLQYDAAGALPIVGSTPFSSTPAARITIAADFRVTKIIDTVGRAIEFFYNTSGRVDRIRDFSGREVKFTYDAANDDLLTITLPKTTAFPLGFTKTFTYTNHNMISIKDTKGQVFVTNRFDPDGRVIEQDLGNRTYYFKYSDVYGEIYNKSTEVLLRPKGSPTSTPLRKSQYRINYEGAVQEILQFTTGLRSGEPYYYATFFVYNSNLSLDKAFLPGGIEMRYTYDYMNNQVLSRGNVLEIRQVGSNYLLDPITKVQYEPKFNFPKAVTDPNGNVTTITYDYELAATDPDYGTTGKLVRIAYPAVAGVTPVASYKYNTYGQVTQITDPNGNVTKIDYGATTGQISQIARDPSGINAITKYTYDVFGNLATITDPNGKVTTLQSNEHGWLLQSTDPLGFKTKFTHDANGNVIKVERQTDAAATSWQITTMTYDVLNNLLTVTDPLNRTTTFTYDVNDNVASVTDALGRGTTYQYDERGLLFKVTDANQPSPGVTTYAYTTNGLLANIVDAKGSQTTYSYDVYDRLVKELLPVNSSYQYAYDKNSNVTQLTRPDGKIIQYTYDALNRLATTVYPSATANNVAYSYDPGSRLTQMVTAAATTKFTYDKLDRVLTDAQIVGGKTYTSTYGYDKAGNRNRVLYPSGKDIRATFDGNDRLLTLGTFNSTTSTTAALAAYVYDPLGRRTQRDLTDGGAVKRSTYGYDLANQLLSVTNQIPGGALFSKFTYTYDAVSNQLTQAAQTASGTKSLTFGYNRLYELTSISGAQTLTYTYDLVGNRTLANGVTYGLNAAHQYTTVAGVTQSYDANGNLTSDGTATYGYDEEGRLNRVVKGGVTTTYTYDGFDRRISKTVGTTATYFVYDGDEIIEERNSTGTTNATYVYGDGLDEALVMARGGSNKYYFQDSLGSVASVTNAAGTMLERYEYSPYGKATIYNASNATITTSAIGNPILFTGRWLDSESGLYDYRARAYAPATGRFLQRDPLGYVDGMNLYSYVNNNPVNLTDPRGESWTLWLTLWPVVVEGGLFVYDSISLYKSLTDPCASKLEKTLTMAAWVSGALSFGGGATLAAKRLAKDALIQRLLAAGRMIDPVDVKGNITKAGRALEKHGGRPGVRKFPKATGNAELKNAQGQRQLEEILRNPNSILKRHPDGTIDVTHPDGRGVRYYPNGELYGFRE